MRETILCMAVLGLLAGCATPSGTSCTWRPADIDPESGQIVAMWIKHRQGDKPVLVTKAYGMLILWTEEKRGFFLFNNESREYLGTTDFDAFLASLRALPQGITIEWIDTCTVPRFTKMPGDAHERLAATLAGNSQKTETPFHACYCESEGLRYLKAEPPAGDDGKPAPQP